jgi:hypothetical protein
MDGPEKALKLIFFFFVEEGNVSLLRLKLVVPKGN